MLKVLVHVIIVAAPCTPMRGADHPDTISIVTNQAAFQGAFVKSLDQRMLPCPSWACTTRREACRTWQRERAYVHTGC